MSMSMSFASLLLLMFSSGQSNELLDLLSTQAYWENKGVVVTAQAMEAELAAREGAAGAQGGPKAASVRRLMAIRALGELKAAQSVGVLKPLLDSKAMFEADYAAAAIAAIEGKPFTRASTPVKELAKDIWMMPAECAMVGQTRLRPGRPVDYAAVMKESGAAGESLPQEAWKELASMLVKAAEQVGNVRLDAVTIGLSGDVGNESGFVVLIARGKYDSARFKKMMLELSPDRARTDTVEGVEVIHPERNTALVVPSDDCLVLMGGPRDDCLPVTAMAKGIKTGRGSLTPESGLGTVISSIDTASPLWAAVKISEAYREASLLAPFDTMTLVATDEKDALAMKLVAKGADAEKVAAAVAEFNKHLQSARVDMAEAKQDSRMPMSVPKPLVDFVASVQAASQGTTAMVTAKMKAASAAPAILPWFILRSRPSPKSPPPGTTRPSAEHF